MQVYGPYATRRQSRHIILPIQQADLDLCCSLTESVDTVVYVDKQKTPSLGCTDAHVDLDLHCPQFAEGPVSCILHQMTSEK